MNIPHEAAGKIRPEIYPRLATLSAPDDETWDNALVVAVASRKWEYLVSHVDTDATRWVDARALLWIDNGDQPVTAREVEVAKEWKDMSITKVLVQVPVMLTFDFGEDPPKTPHDAFTRLTQIDFQAILYSGTHAGRAVEIEFYRSIIGFRADFQGRASDDDWAEEYFMIPNWEEGLTTLPESVPNRHHPVSQAELRRCCASVLTSAGSSGQTVAS